MAAPRPFALIKGGDQWCRAAFEDAALVDDIVQLAWTDEEDGEDERAPAAAPAGLAFDSHCRLFRALPEAGQVERWLWAALDPLSETAPPEPLSLFSSPATEAYGDFASATPVPSLNQPASLAIDDDDRLFIGELGSRTIQVFDLWTEDLLRTIAVDGRPVDLGSHGRDVYAVISEPSGLLRLRARSGPWRMDLPAGVSSPSRLAVSPDGKVMLLEGDRITPYDDPASAFTVPDASGIEFLGEDVLVVARRPGQDFLRFRITATAREELASLKGRAYDGRGIVRTPDGRIGFFTAKGFRHAVSARLRYRPRARVTTFRLDSGAFHTSWGRLFLDACIPKDTSIRFHCVASDDPPEEAILGRTPPVNIGAMTVWRPDLSPPMPPLSFVPPPGGAVQTLHRRETGVEQPWVPSPPEDVFKTYEAPLATVAGRYLWITLDLRGNTRKTPQVRTLRAEYPSHDYLRRIPKVFSRDERVEFFLRRFLAMFEGTLGEFEAKAGHRDSLIRPESAKTEMLDWLAGLVGLVMDQRWPEHVRRRMIAEAVWLFRFRGAIQSLSRMIEIYIGVRPVFIEKFRLRGLGGVLSESSTVSRSVLGAGLRVGGALGDPEANPLAGQPEDSFETFAHRFSVLIPAALTDEQLSVVRQILEVHRPAHTLVDVCTVASGMRVGVGLNIGLNSIIGRGGGFKPLVAGGSRLGKGAIVGRPGAGTYIGGSILGGDSRVG